MKNKSYIGISFIILVFGILVVPKIIDRIQNGSVTSADRLDKVQKETLENTSLVKIGPTPHFELTDQNGQKVTNDTYKGKVFVIEFFFTSCPTICPKMNQSMLGTPILVSLQLVLIPKKIRLKFLKSMLNY
jgi:protein SCO1/2